MPWSSASGIPIYSHLYCYHHVYHVLCILLLLLSYIIICYVLCRTVVLKDVIFCITLNLFLNEDDFMPRGVFLVFT